MESQSQLSREEENELMDIVQGDDTLQSSDGEQSQNFHNSEKESESEKETDSNKEVEEESKESEESEESEEEVEEEREEVESPNNRDDQSMSMIPSSQPMQTFPPRRHPKPSNKKEKIPIPNDFSSAKDLEQVSFIFISYDIFIIIE